MSELRVLRAGVVEHHVMAEAMREMQQQRINDKIPDTLILVEHPEIVTVGPKAVRDGVEVQGYPTSLTDRGGGITWHGPGQLVVYPIVKWGVAEQSIRAIIGKLEDWAIVALADCGVPAYKDPSMQGAWVDGHKVCSIGLSFLHWVSRHGMSINIRTPGTRVQDLEGCGISAGVHSSLAHLGYARDIAGNPVDISRVERALLENCEASLGRSPSQPVEWGPEMPA